MYQQHLYPSSVENTGNGTAPSARSPVSELQWFYLDSFGQEFGPIAASSMRQWLFCGRFPTGGELLIRLSEWNWHVPLRTVYPNLSKAFQIAPEGSALKPANPMSGSLG